MPLDFPPSPSPGDIYTLGTRSWEWTGDAWKLLATSSINNTPIGNLTANTGNFTTVTVNSTVSSNLIPSANVTYNLGNTTNRWNDIWLANSTIHLGEATISASGANIQLPANVQIGSITLSETDGALNMPEDMTANSVQANVIKTDNFQFANGSPFASYSNAEVVTLLASFGSNSISTTGNIRTDNFQFANGDPFSSFSASDLANLGSNNISTTGNISAGNISADIFSTARTISASTTISNINAQSTGPVTIANGVTVTVSSGGVWSVL
jgi:hypothetical protein